MAKTSKKTDRLCKRLNLRNALVTKGEETALFSRQVDIDRDPFTKLYDSNELIIPPYDFERLYRIYEESDVIQSCVEAMQNNIDGFGYQLQFLGDDRKEKTLPSAVLEKEIVSDFFNQVNEGQSFTTIRKLRREDIEVLGNGAFEVIRNKLGQIQMLYYMPFKYLRMTFVGTEPIDVPTTLRRNGKDIQVVVKKYFRKYAQIDSSGKKLRWFKEFGDPRTLSAVTGKYINNPTIKASEIMHYKLSFGGMPYGMPRWIGAILDAMGRRSASYVNYDLFESQGIPPLAVLVSGGVLTDESLDELSDIVRSLRGAGKWNKIMLLESNIESVGLEDKGSAKIELKNLSEYRKEDQMFNQYLESTEKHVRHRFRLPPLYIGAAECYSEDTETLTENGWRYYWEVKKGEKIGTINPITFELEYHVPTSNARVYDVNGPMNHFKNKVVDSLVTPNHDMWVAKRRHNTQWYKEKANKIFKTDNPYYRVLFQVSSSYYNEKSIDIFSLPVIQKRTGIVKYTKPIPMDLMLSLIGLYIGDGAYDSRDGSHGINFEVKKERKKKIIKYICSQFQEFEGLSYSTCEKSREGYEKISIYGRGLSDWMRNNCGSICYNKKIPDAFLKLNSRQSRLILEGLIATDGNVRTGRTHETLKLPKACRFVTTSIELVHQVQLLAFKCGYRAVISEGHDSRPNRCDVYYVNMKKAIDVQIHNFQHEVIQYKGKVFCFEVPNHLFVTRRNGKIAIHGNSFTHATAKAAQTVAEEQVFIPERMENDEIVNIQILKNELNILQWIFKSKGPKIVGSTDIPKGVETFSRAGAFSINHAIEQANAAFGLEMSKYDELWADYPIPMVTELLKAGRLKETEGIAEKIAATNTAISSASSAASPVKATQLKLPGQVTKSVFSDKEIDLYRSLKAIQTTIEQYSGHTYDDTVNTGL